MKTIKFYNINNNKSNNTNQKKKSISKKKKKNNINMVNKTIINMKITITKDTMILDNNNNPYKKYRIHKKWSRMNKYLLKIISTKKSNMISKTKKTTPTR